MLSKKRYPTRRIADTRIAAKPHEEIFSITPIRRIDSTPYFFFALIIEPPDTVAVLPGYILTGNAMLFQKLRMVHRRKQIANFQSFQTFRIQMKNDRIGISQFNGVPSLRENRSLVCVTICHIVILPSWIKDRPFLRIGVKVCRVQYNCTVCQDIV